MSDVFTEFLTRYQHEPVLFVKEMLGVAPQPWQSELLEDICSGSRLIAVKAGHGVGKSTAASWAALHTLLCCYPTKVVLTAPTSGQLFDALYAELKSQLNQLPPALKNLFEVYSDRVVLKADPSSSFLSVRTARKESPEALQGVHSSGKVLLVVDEASAVDEAIFAAAGGSLSGNATLLLLGNPVRRSGYFFDVFHKAKSRWILKTVSCIGSPLVEENYIEELRERYSEDSDTWRVRVLGEFPEGAANTVISNEIVESAVGRDVEITATSIVWGLDVARFGTDRSALCKRQGNTVLEPIKSWSQIDTMQLCGAVMKTYETSLDEGNEPSEILCDVIGVGASIVDRGTELGLPIHGINTGESASLSGIYKNLRSELWYLAREWFENKSVRIPRDNRLIYELCTPTYGYDSRGKIRVESKDEMKRRLGSRGSPDYADAFILTFASNASIASGRFRTWKQKIQRKISGVV